MFLSLYRVLVDIRSFAKNLDCLGFMGCILLSMHANRTEIIVCMHVKYAVEFVGVAKANFRSHLDAWFQSFLFPLAVLMHVRIGLTKTYLHFHRTEN